MTSRKHSGGRRARFAPRNHELAQRHAKSARSNPAIDVGRTLRDSQPFHAFSGDGGPAHAGQAVPPTPVEAPPSPPLLRSIDGWMPAAALPDGRLAVRLEELPGFPDAPLVWPVVDLTDGSLAVLVRDLQGGSVQ